MPTKTLIAVKNLSTVVKDGDLEKALPAFQKQVSEDFFGTWGVDAGLKLIPKAEKTPAGAWLLGVFDDADQAGALGYHDLTRTGLPLGKVFARTTIGNHGLWTVTFLTSRKRTLDQEHTSRVNRARDPLGLPAWAQQRCGVA